MEKIGADDYRASKLRNWLEKRNMQKSGNKATLEARLNGLLKPEEVVRRLVNWKSLY